MAGFPIKTPLGLVKSYRNQRSLRVLSNLVSNGQFELWLGVLDHPIQAMETSMAPNLTWTKKQPGFFGDFPDTMNSSMILLRTPT
jgi:hypothetical protein